MDSNQYQFEALRTAGKDDAMMSALGMAGEAGEFANKVKKWKYHGHAYDPRIFLDEAGDVLWYVAVAAATHGYSLDEVMRFNIDKLKKRYPDGFDSEKSINRTE
jgi:NTP pyrophosphatase (non-canonical NTP hydrolase)